MSDLDKLIEAIELGDWVGQFDDVLNVKQYKYAAKAYHGSLDAAKALHEALLPAFRFRIEDCYVFVWYGPSGQFYAPCDPYGNPARSWLIAILKGYRSLK